MTDKAASREDMVGGVSAPAVTPASLPTATAQVGFDADRLVSQLFAEEGRSLVRLARLFCDDRNAAEDLVQEAFIRLHRSAHTIRDRQRAPAFLRSIVLNIARDHNRRGLMSLRHQQSKAAKVDTGGSAMNVEQRLTVALRRIDTYEPSPDLWARVVHSIERDRAHRRRVVRTVVGIVISFAGLVLFGMLALEDGPNGPRLDWAVLEALEAIGLTGLVLGLGPAMRRFGRGYCGDMFPTVAGFGVALLRVLDLAFYLVFAGYILLSVDFESPTDRVALADQLEATAGRVGGLLLAMGLLHAITFMFVPLLALVHNSTGAGKPLPRWVTALLFLIGAAMGLLLLPALVGLVAGAA